MDLLLLDNNMGVWFLETRSPLVHVGLELYVVKADLKGLGPPVSTSQKQGLQVPITPG